MLKKKPPLLPPAPQPVPVTKAKVGRQKNETIEKLEWFDMLACVIPFLLPREMTVSLGWTHPINREGIRGEMFLLRAPLQELYISHHKTVSEEKCKVNPTNQTTPWPMINTRRIVLYTSDTSSIPTLPSRYFRADRLSPDLYDLYNTYDLAHAAGWERYNLHDLGNVSWVGYVLSRSCTAFHNGTGVSR